MKLEVGKSYLTRNGLRATCVADNLRGEAPCAVIIRGEEYDMLERYHNDGVHRRWKTEDIWDLISEWVEKPEVNWSVIPPWFQWVAMDADESWYAIINKPKINETSCIWTTENPRPAMEIHPDYAPKWTGDWRKSLVERPKV